MSQREAKLGLQLTTCLLVQMVVETGVDRADNLVDLVTVFVTIGGDGMEVHKAGGLY